MKKHQIIGIVVVSFLFTLGYLCHITLKNDKAKKQDQKEDYLKTEQKDYNRKYDSVHPVITVIPTRYRNLDSIKLRTQIINGCTWSVRINGTGSDKYFHTDRTCPACINFLLSLKCECK